MKNKQTGMEMSIMFYKAKVLSKINMLPEIGHRSQKNDQLL